MSELVAVEAHEQAAVIRLTREGKLNAISSAVETALLDAGAVFSLPEVALGILPSWGGTLRLVRALAR